MDKTSADLQREVEWLRRDTSLILGELEDRARGAFDARRQVREHPLAVGLVGTSLLAFLGLIGYAVYSRVGEKRRSRSAAERYLEAAKELIATQRDKLQSALPVEVELRPAGHADEKPGLVKQVLYSGLTKGSAAVASFFAGKLSEYLWRKLNA